MVYDLPQPDFNVTPSALCAGNGNTQFNGWPTTHVPPGPSEETDNPIIEWNWDFDEPGSTGNILLGQVVGDAIYAYSTAGIYDVELTVIDDKGCKADIVKQIVISTPIEARADVQPTCKGDSTTLDGTISTIGTTVWNWDTDGDLTTIEYTGDIVQHIFPHCGYNTYTLMTEAIVAGNTCYDTFGAAHP